MFYDHLTFEDNEDDARNDDGVERDGDALTNSKGVEHTGDAVTTNRNVEVPRTKSLCVPFTPKSFSSSPASWCDSFCCN